MSALDTRTAAQAREHGDTRAWLHLWMKASREGASEAKLQTIARGIAATKTATN